MPPLSRSGSLPQKFLLTGLLALTPGVFACSDDGQVGDGGTAGSATTSSAGASVVPTAGIPGAGGSPGGGATGALSATTGGSVSSIAGAGSPEGASAYAGSSGAPAAGAAGMGGAPVGVAGTANAGHEAVHDHCVYGYSPHPTDETMKDGPFEFYPPGKTDPSIVDTTVQPEVIQWMEDNFWEEAHIEWHAIRTCNLPGGVRGSKVNICQFVDMIPKDQNCASTGDGYQFMLFHRHMLEALRQLWPKHSEQFTGFAKFPQSAEDVPPQWRSAWRPFTATDLANAKLAEEIDKPENLAKFPDEGALGFWFQCNLGTMISGFNMKAGGLHGALHGHWIRQGNTQHGVGNTQANIHNYMFWKLHGWMDNQWEKYRLAKGITRTDPKYIADMQAQCREMDIEADISRRMGLSKPGTAPGVEPLAKESGFFHERVRPIFESNANLCSGCHSESGPEAFMSLGGHISSKDIVAGLVDKQAIGGGQYKRVAPGKPDESWLYLKIVGMTGRCTETANARCYPGPMPPTSDQPTVSAGDAAIVRQWILDGAKGPE